MKTKTTRINHNGLTLQVKNDSPFLAERRRALQTAALGALGALAIVSLLLLAFLCGSTLPAVVRQKPAQQPPCDANV